MFSHTYFRKRRGATMDTIDKFASKKPCLESCSGSGIAAPRSSTSPALLGTSTTSNPLQQVQEEEEEEEGEQSILDFFKQHQEPLNSDSWVVNDDFNHYDYDFHAYGAEDYHYGVKGGVPSPCGDAYASLSSFTESICSSLKALAV